MNLSVVKMNYSKNVIHHSTAIMHFVGNFYGLFTFFHLLFIP